MALHIYFQTTLFQVAPNVSPFQASLDHPADIFMRNINKIVFDMKIHSLTESPVDGKIISSVGEENQFFLKLEYFNFTNEKFS